MTQSVPFITGKFVRQGASLATGTMIDAYLTEADCKKLYARWHKDWEVQPTDLRGGEKIITCEMVLEIPFDIFLKVMGNSAGERILEIAKRNAGR